MKAKSLSGLVMYVQDPKKSVDFYEKLGFTLVSQDSGSATMRLNWFSIDFLAASAEEKENFKAEANAEVKGSGLYIYLSVDDVDAAYKDLVDAEIKPSSQPRDWPWGNREFVVRDPNGYKLVIFKRHKKRNPAE